jgi:hypothetical protein
MTIFSVSLLEEYELGRAILAGRSETPSASV